MRHRFMLTSKRRQGVQGTYDAAPKQILAAEFNTEDEDEVIEKILKSGSIQTMEVRKHNFPGITTHKMAMMLTLLVADAEPTRCQER